MLIDRQEDLVPACSQATTTPYCAVDVEFNRRNTYAPEVALVQIAGRGIPTVLLDTVQLPDPSPIAKFLAKRGPGMHHVCVLCYLRNAAGKLY